MWSAFDDPVADANNDDNVTSNPSVIDANILEDDACSTSSTTSSSTADDAPDGDALGGEPMSPKSHLRKPPGATSLFAARSAPDDVWFDPSLNQRVARRVMRKISTMVFSKQRLHDTTDEDFTSSGPTTPQLPVGGVGGDGGRVGSTSGTGTGTGTAPSNAVTATPSLASPTLSADLNSSSTRDTLDPWSTAPNDDSSQVDRGSSSSLGQSATVRGASFGASSSLPLIPKELRARSKRPKGSDIRHLASGGNGSVYLAAVGKQAVVVKVTSYEDAMRESSVLRRLATLPNIIRLLGFSCKPHRASMVVLEYGEGGSLREHASLLRMTIGEARWAAERESVARPLIRQMVVAVCELHARGIVHFDLKCGNFVLSRDRSVAKLIDFGTCRMTASSPMRRVSACDIRSVQASPNVIARTALSNVTPTVQPSNVPVVCAAHWLDSDNDDDNDAAAAAAAGGGAEGHDGDVDGHDDVRTAQSS